MSEEIKDVDYKKIGENIRLIRMAKGTSQIKLARSLDISQTHMSNIEKGHAGISLWTAVKISRELGCSIDSFADEERYTKEQKDTVDSDNRIDIDDLIAALKLISRENKNK